MFNFIKSISYLQIILTTVVVLALSTVLLVEYELSTIVENQYEMKASAVEMAELAETDNSVDAKFYSSYGRYLQHESDAILGLTIIFGRTIDMVSLATVAGAATLLVRGSKKQSGCCK